MSGTDSHKVWTSRNQIFTVKIMSFNSSRSWPLRHGFIFIRLDLAARPNAVTDQCCDGPVLWRASAVTGQCSDGPVLWRANEVTDQYCDGPVQRQTSAVTDQYCDGPLLWRTCAVTDQCWQANAVTDRAVIDQCRAGLVILRTDPDTKHYGPICCRRGTDEGCWHLSI